MPSLAELLEARKKSKEPSELQQLSKGQQDLEQRLESLRDMVVNREVLDSAGNGILELIEDIRLRHEEYIMKAAGAIAKLEEDKDSMAEALKDMEETKLMQVSKLNGSIDRMMMRSGATAEGVSMLNDKFTNMEAAMNNLAMTMSQVLGVLQSPKRVEFNEDGMPIAVRVD